MEWSEWKTQSEISRCENEFFHDAGRFLPHFFALFDDAFLSSEMLLPFMQGFWSRSGGR